MPLDIDYNFGRLAVEKGYLRQEELEECVELLVALQRVGSSRRLWDVVAQRAYMSTEQIDEIRRELGAEASAPTAPGGTEPAPAPAEGGTADEEDREWDISLDAEVAPLGDDSEPAPGDVPGVVPLPKRPPRRFHPGELQVTCVEGPLKGRSFILAGRRTVIGRDEKADVVIKDPSVSRRHAEIRFGPRGIVVEDLHSRNSVYVNGVRVEKAPLRPGCAVRIGRCLLIVEAVPRPSHGA